jgi:hypothetical protein
MWKLVEQLLDVADSLAALDKRRPRQASLRRAVSSAYYALFHRLGELCANELVGWRKPWEAYSPIYRSIEHGRALNVLTERGSDRKHPLGEEIERIGVAFKELQAAREWADYNPEPHPNPSQTLAGEQFSREDAIQLIAIAREAIGVVDKLDDAVRLNLATRLVTRSRKETRR